MTGEEAKIFSAPVEISMVIRLDSIHGTLSLDTRIRDKCLRSRNGTRDKHCAIRSTTSPSTSLIPKNEEKVAGSDLQQRQRVQADCTLRRVAVEESSISAPMKLVT